MIRVDCRHFWRRSGLLVTLLLSWIGSAAAQSFSSIHDFSPAAGNPQSEVIAISSGRLAGTTVSGGLYGFGSIYVMTPDGAGGYNFTEPYSFTGSSDGSNPTSALVLGADGSLYGVANGGSSGSGVLFRTDEDGNNFEVLHAFVFSEGSGPMGIIQASDGLLYGTLVSGGDFFSGSVFVFDPLASTLTVLHSFSNDDGTYPRAPVMEGADGLLYGVTSSGGCCFSGTVYQLDKLGATFTVIHGFTGPDGSDPVAALFQGPDSFLYGTTASGGANFEGTIFKVDSSGATFAVLHDLSQSDGIVPLGALSMGADGLLYGTTANSNFSSAGSVFRVSTDGSEFDVVHTFAPSDGQSPAAGLLLAADGTFLGTTQYGGDGGNGTVYRLDPTTGVVTVEHNFVSPDAFTPVPGVVRGADGFLYGIASNGGAHGVGAVYRMTETGGSYSIVHSFSGPDGSFPTNPLLATPDGSIYGTSPFGGSSGSGTVFRIAPGGSFSLVHDFSYYSDGGEPLGGVILGSDGFLYGTTVNGGATSQGVVYRVGTSGQSFAVIHTFTAAGPQAGLLQGADGLLYGTTFYGGSLGYGTVFRLQTSGGSFKLLHEFNHDDGAWPSAALIQLSDGMLYGTTSAGTPLETGVIFTLDTKGHKFSVLHAFTGPDGFVPFSALLQASDGLLYGTTFGGGSGGSGTVFHLLPTGAGFGLSHEFSGSDGASVFATLVQGSDGALYGTAKNGGAMGGGVAFRMDRARYALAITKSGTGSGTVTSSPAGIDCGSACSATFLTGTVVTLTPAPASNSLFAGWTGDPDCADGSVTMGSDKTCTATFNLGPDLVVFAVTGPASGAAGQSITVQDITKNVGAAGAAGSVTRYYLSTDSNFDGSDVPLGSRVVPALAAGGSSTGNATLTIPMGTAAGNYFLLAVADADGAVVETNETNNVRARTIVIH